MSFGSKNLWDRMLLGPCLLIGLLLLLAICWWSLSFNLFPEFNAPSPDEMIRDRHYYENPRHLALDHRLGWWIGDKGWDAGPPDEYAYDFIFFWHMGLSVLVYLGILLSLHHKAATPADLSRTVMMLNSMAVKRLFVYPVICAAIIWVFPWGKAVPDIGAHRFLSVIFCLPFYCSLTVISVESWRNGASKILGILACLLIAGICFHAPIHGGGIGFLVFMGVIIMFVVWAFTLILRNVKRGSA
jgi:hypothetical protein